MLIGGIVLGLVLGLLSGGRLTNIASVQLRWTWVLFAAVIVRFGTEALLNQGVDVVEALRLPLLSGGFALLLIALWVNRSYPGMSLAFVGILLNALVITINGGFMPIWEVALTSAGLGAADVTSAIHVVVAGEAADFLVRGLILGDVIPIPFPIVQNVASIGDVFLTLGLAFFLFASVVRVPTRLEAHEEEAIRQRLFGLAGTARLPRDGDSPQTGVVPQTGLTPSIMETAALERPSFLGSQTTGTSSPALAPLPAADPDTPDLEAAAATTLPRPSPETLARVRRHPYVRLALNGSFTALWAGQLISLFGDRLHQVALTVAVLVTTGSPALASFVFVAAFIPNLVFSPIAGTFVDRWDHKEVLIVSDLLRAATVLIIPIALATNVLLVFPLVFLMTTISIFFRPARVAILPRIVSRDELVTANSALWVGETLADFFYPVAGLFVVALGSAISVAFWLDAATYIGSAALLSTLVIGRARSGVRDDEDGFDDEDDDEAETDDLPALEPERVIDGGPVGRFMGELKAGYRFLRSEPTLFANTIQAAVAQLGLGVLTAMAAVYARAVFESDPIGWEAIWTFMETSIGIGNLVGGFLLGLIGARVAKGRTISGAYALWGVTLVLLAMTDNLAIVIGLAFGAGVANMAFVIPSQALFQERTPQDLMGRVVGFRFALVFGSMAIAMAAGGILSELVGVTLVIAVSGVVSLAAGLAGFLIPALRDAD